MAGPESKKNIDVFDLSRLRDLVELMNEYELHEVDLRQEKQHIRIARGPEIIAGAAPMPAPTMTPAATPAPTAKADGTAAPVDAEAATSDTANVVTIDSPMVGTFYSKPNPDSPTFVKVGDVVNSDTVVCIIEAMKVFNEIPAEMSGRVVGVLVDNEESVEFGKPLFKIEIAT